MEVLKTAILEFCRRKKKKSFQSDEVIKAIYPQDWEHFRDELRLAALELSREEKIFIIQNRVVVDPGLVPVGIFEIQKRNQTR